MCIRDRDKGCKYIQIDEPLFARQVEDALSFGIEGVERCLHKVPKDVNKIIHICCGYTDHLDDENYKKADPESYFSLSGELNSMGIDQISIEDAHFRNDLRLLEKFLAKETISCLLPNTLSNRPRCKALSASNTSPLSIRFFAFFLPNRFIT